MKTGWQTKPLGEVCTLQRGFDLPTQDRISGRFPLVSSSGITDTHSEGPVSGPGVVTGRSGSIGNVFFIDDSFWPLNTTLYVRDFHGNDPRFVFHLLNEFDLKRFSGGTGVPTLNRNDVHGEMVKVPAAVTEQQRIVTLLDDAFDRIAIAKSNAEKNLQNARALFETYLESTFAQRNDDWTLKRLGDLATFRNGINFTKSSRGDTVKIVGVRDFQKDFWAPLDTLATVTTDGALPESDLLKENDLLFVRSNGNKELIGRCLLLGPVGERITHSGFTIRARLHGGDVRARYLCHFLKSNKARREMIDSGAGANISSLNQTALAGLVIPFPSVSAQGLIVQQIQTVAAQTQRLESIYQQKLAALDELKKSLLHQAFSGAL